MMIKPSLGLMLSMALLSACADATVFVWTDSQGGRHYSDQPQLNATQLHVEPDTTYYRVHKVVDGDTVQLDNGLKVRLLGVNSPEVAGRFKQAESGGDVAKHWLTQRLQGLRVSLEQDAEAQDRYQRRLAYLLDEQHNNINIELVRNGLATVNVYPPNFKYLEALVAAQQQAEQEHKGLWGNPAYAAKSYQALTVDNYHVWQRIRGRIPPFVMGASMIICNFPIRLRYRCLRLVGSGSLIYRLILVVRWKHGAGCAKIGSICI